MSLKGDYKKLLYQQPIDRTYVVELEKRKKGNKISILSDSMFKTMFYNESRMKYSCKFLSYFLDISYEDLLKNLKLSKNELNKNKENSKGERSDYVAKIGDVYINIEVNCNNSVETMERNMDYAYHLYSIKIKVGSDYNYSQVIQFNINNFAFKGNDKIIDTFYVQNDERILLNDKLIFVQIYVPNLIKKWYTSGIESLTEVERFILTLVEQGIEKAKELGKGDSIMEEYIEESIEVGEDISFGEAYDKEWALKDQGRREGFDDGMAEGIIQGIEQKQVEIVKNMLKENVDISLISKVTGLSKEEIEKLK